MRQPTSVDSPTVQTALLWARGNEVLISNLNTYQSSRLLEPSSPHLGLLQYHIDRLHTARLALHTNSPDTSGEAKPSLCEVSHLIENRFAESTTSVSKSAIQLYKVQILVDPHGDTNIKSINIGEVSSEDFLNSTIPNFLPRTLHPYLHHHDSCRTPCKVWIDSNPTKASTLTTHKTTSRHVYNEARARAGLTLADAPTAKEVLLWNQDDQIMEASYSTVYFYRHGSWMTPGSSCGGHLGVSRRLALEEGLCVEGTVGRGDVEVGEEIWLSNAVRGFFPGVIVGMVACASGGG